MGTLPSFWSVRPQCSLSQDWIQAVRAYGSGSEGKWVAQLLWQRGIRTLEQLGAFLNPQAYTPQSPWVFGSEMEQAVQRLGLARDSGEQVTIWGDFDADGITATSVLWEGLGQFLPQGEQLNYYIPNRLKESHGLNRAGVERLAQAGTTLIVTCDTGSTNQAEIELAAQLGLDVIVSDHHALPDQRPRVSAIINSRYLSESNPLYHLSGVAIAYKLVEALYLELPDVPQQPLEQLLDLVAIGLIADLVQLSGDCRYLAQLGIEQLQKQASPLTMTRPGVGRLLALCKRSGDRPTDISFGLGPRINAVSRIQGDASFCVELLTCRDPKRAEQLALATEIANTRRKALQKSVTEQVKQQVFGLDLSTTGVIVLVDGQWPAGVLGLVAGQIAQEYGRPTILLTTASFDTAPEETIEQATNQTVEDHDERSESDTDRGTLARGSARSANRINLYELVQSQASLLHGFGGHPFAAGLSLPIENIAPLREGLNQALRREYTDFAQMVPTIEVDLIVTVADLGRELFRELKLLEPCGMGNPVPKLLIQNVWFEGAKNFNAQDARGKKVQYIKTLFELWDHSAQEGFPGVWWGHYQNELPKGDRADVVVELDFNAYAKRYEVRLIDVQRMGTANIAKRNAALSVSLVDWRHVPTEQQPLEDTAVAMLATCPTSWTELGGAYQRAIAQQHPLALAYGEPINVPAQERWQQLVGAAKYLSRTGKTIEREHFKEKFKLSERSLVLGLHALQGLGFQVDFEGGWLQVTGAITPSPTVEESLTFFCAVWDEEQFQRQYFYQVPVSVIQNHLAQMTLVSQE